MTLSEYTFRLMLLFLPGVLAFIIIDNLTIHRETKVHHWVIYTFLLGFLSYFPWMFLCEIHGIIYGQAVPTQFLSNLVDKNAPINFYEILIATIFSLIWGLVLTKIINSRCFFTLSVWLKITNKFPEIDSWANCVAHYHPSWVNVRDIGNNRVYRGRIFSTSDATERDGIVLEDVTVYDENATELYKVPVIYLPQKMENLIIELI